MPHFIMEYSANLDVRVDMTGLCRHIRQTMMDTGEFETGAVRVRAIRCDHYAIADELPENGFIDMSLRMGAGRPEELRKEIGEAIFEAAKAYLAELFETPHFALSLEIREISPALSWKKNAMHPRLRAKEAK